MEEYDVVIYTLQYHNDETLLSQMVKFLKTEKYRICVIQIVGKGDYAINLFVIIRCTRSFFQSKNPIQ